MYKSFYNLQENPFQLNANLDFFYYSASHKRAKAYLRYGLIQGEGFVVVTGMPGTGKTMLVKDLSQFLKEDEDIVVGLMVTSQVGAEDTLRMLISVFSIDHEYDDSKASLINSLKNFFIECARKGKRALLVVDEAQNLPKQSIEELRMLTNFECDGKAVFQVFLVGQEELGKILYASDMEQVKQRIVASCHLKAIDQQEIKDYIFFRLEKAGWKKNPQFDEAVFEAIYNFTKGIPRRINTLCDRLLLYGYLEELNEITLDHVNTVTEEILADHNEANNELAPEKFVYQHAEIDESVNDRLNRLENQIAQLSDSIAKEKALLRKAILIQLDMDDVFKNN